MEREWGSGLVYRSSEHRRLALPHWLDYCNERRPHSELGGPHRSVVFGRPWAGQLVDWASPRTPTLGKPESQAARRIRSTTRRSLLATKRALDTISADSCRAESDRSSWSRSFRGCGCQSSQTLRRPGRNTECAAHSDRTTESMDRPLGEAPSRTRSSVSVGTPCRRLRLKKGSINTVGYEGRTAPASS